LAVLTKKEEENNGPETIAAAKMIVVWEVFL